MQLCFKLMHYTPMDVITLLKRTVDLTKNKLPNENDCACEFVYNFSQARENRQTLKIIIVAGANFVRSKADIGTIR